MPQGSSAQSGPAAGSTCALAAAGELLGVELVDVELRRRRRSGSGELDATLTLRFVDGERIRANVRRFLGPQAPLWMTWALLINQGVMLRDYDTAAHARTMQALANAARRTDDASVTGDAAEAIA